MQDKQRQHMRAAQIEANKQAMISKAMNALKTSKSLIRNIAIGDTVIIAKKIDKRTKKKKEIAGTITQKTAMAIYVRNNDTGRIESILLAEILTGERVLRKAV